MVEYEIKDCEIKTTKNKIFEFVCEVASELGLVIPEKQIKEKSEDLWYDFEW